MKDKSSMFAAAVRLIDAANASDPNIMVVDGERRPKELVHAEMLTAWVLRLRPEASEPLLLAARGHHIRRWTVPRSSYPEGRRGYLRWRTKLLDFHAQEVATILGSVGYKPSTIERTSAIIRKQGLLGEDRDEEVQVLEDGLCLVFLETQYEGLIPRMDRGKLVDILRRTWGKMSLQAQKLALQLRLSPEGRDLILAALSHQDA